VALKPKELPVKTYVRRAETRAMRALAVCAVAATCARDVPVAPKPPSDPATEQLAALATALTDAQRWLLPSRDEHDVAADAIAGRFTELSTSLAQGETDAVAARIAAARQALEVGTPDESGEHFIQLAALGLTLDGVEAVIEGKLPIAPETLRAAADRSQQ
jgi:hypothetical protein